MNASDWIGLRLDPLDTLLFRDGRPFEASTRAEGGLPMPQTLAGALRTALLARTGFDLGALARRCHLGDEVPAALAALGAPSWIVETRLRGPWLAENAGVRVKPLIPVPALLRRSGDTWYRSRPLAPKQLPGWEEASGRWPIWRFGGSDAKSPGGFLSSDGLAAFLRGGVPSQEDWRSPSEVFTHDERTGIAVDRDTLTADEGMIYGIRFLVLREGHSLYAEIQPGPGAPPLEPILGTPIALGGEGRHVSISVLPRPFAWPEMASARRNCWLLVTPAFLTNPHAPEVVTAPAHLRAAATGPPTAVSGWDALRNGPRPTRFAVPAGSIYFVEGDFSPPHGSFCAETEAAAQGWGMALRGTWNDE